MYPVHVRVLPWYEHGLFNLGILGDNPYPRDMGVSKNNGTPKSSICS